VASMCENPDAPSADVREQSSQRYSNCFQTFIQHKLYFT